MRPGRARAARGRVTGGRPNQSALGWTPARGRESRARSPTSPVSPARGPRLAAGGEPAPRQKRISRASRAGTGFARRVRRACVPPRGLRTGHVARHGCRVGLRKAATGGRARRSVCLDGSWSVFFAFSWKRQTPRMCLGHSVAACYFYTFSRLATIHKVCSIASPKSVKKGKPPAPTGAFHL